MFWNAKGGRIHIEDTDMDYITFGQGDDVLVMIPGLGDGLTTVKGMALPLAYTYRMYAKDYSVYIFSRKNHLEKYAEKGINPVYIINRPLEEKNASYGYEKGIVVLIPKHKIMFINYGNNKKKFNDFYEDFVEDLGQLSKKYDYMKILGRPRQWKNEFTVTYNYEDVKELVLSDFLEKNK